MPADEINKRLEQTVQDIPIENLMGRTLFDISWGEKQKIACASVTTPVPDVVIY